MGGKGSRFGCCGAGPPSLPREARFERVPCRPFDFSLRTPPPPRAQKIQPVRENGNLLLCTLLLGNVAVNALLSIVMAELTSGLVGFLLATAIITIFGEIVPQVRASREVLSASCFSLLRRVPTRRMLVGGGSGSRQRVSCPAGEPSAQRRGFPRGAGGQRKEGRGGTGGGSPASRRRSSVSVSSGRGRSRCEALGACIGPPWFDVHTLRVVSSYPALSSGGSPRQ